MRSWRIPLIGLMLVGFWIYTRIQPGTRLGDEHGHRPGAHGGVIVPIGRDRFHLEAIHEEGALLKLYTLGQDESRVIDVEEQMPTAYVTPEGDVQARPVRLRPEPRPGDGPGKASVFVGRLPEEFGGRALEVSIPGFTIEGERFRIGFTMAGRGGAVVMPQKVDASTEQALYLTAGGKYSDTDIAANGGTTPSQRYRGFRASHDPSPRPGERICPVTRTRANPECTWILAGDTYQFCCPPCIDEFVRLAKEEPEQIRAAGDYLQ